MARTSPKLKHPLLSSASSRVFYVHHVGRRRRYLSTRAYRVGLVRRRVTVIRATVVCATNRFDGNARSPSSPVVITAILFHASPRTRVYTGILSLDRLPPPLRSVVFVPFLISWFPLRFQSALALALVSPTRSKRMFLCVSDSGLSRIFQEFV